FSMSRPRAISISSETWRTFSSDRCMGSRPVERGEADVARRAARRRQWVGFERRSWFDTAVAGRAGRIGTGVLGNSGIGGPPGRWVRPVVSGAWPAGRNPAQPRDEAFASPGTRGMDPGGLVAAPPKCEWLRLRTVQRSEVAVQKNGKLGFRQGADLARHHGAVLEQHQGRDAAHRVLGGGRRVLVHVQLGDLDPTVVVARNLVEDRR